MLATIYLSPILSSLLISLICWSGFHTQGFSSQKILLKYPFCKLIEYLVLDNIYCIKKQFY